MSGDKYIKHAIIASLVEHPEAEKYRNRAFSGENLDEAMRTFTGAGHKISKADLFQPDDEGRSVIDCPGFWRNFDKVRSLVAQNGDTFGLDDFTRPLSRSSNRTLLDSAKDGRELGRIFNAAVWAGRHDQMELLWYKVPLPARRELFGNDGHPGISLKRTLLASEGRTAPEDMLSRSNLVRSDIGALLKTEGGYNEMKISLAQSGDWLRKEYVLLPDAAGDTPFHDAKAWPRYADVVKGMQENGERFEVADFIRQLGNASNILTRAAQHGVLDKVFAPAHWENRLNDMVELWSHVLDGWKRPPMTPAAFDRAYAEAEGLTYDARVDFAALAGKKDLLQPVNDGGQPVIALGLISFWKNLPAVETRLAATGEKITLADLRQPSGPFGDSCLIHAVKSGNFARALDVLKKSGEKLSVQDFLSADRSGNRLINLLADRKELSLAFTPDLWAGRVPDMKDLWSKTRVKDRDQMDIHQAEVAAKQETIRLQARDKYKFQPKPKKPGVG